MRSYAVACAMVAAALAVEVLAEPWYVRLVHSGHVAIEGGIEVAARVADASVLWASLCVPLVRNARAQLCHIT